MVNFVIQIYTLADRSQMVLYVPTAKEVNRYYDPNLFLHDELKAQLGSLLAKVSPFSFFCVIYHLFIIWLSFSCAFLTA